MAREREARPPKYGVGTTFRTRGKNSRECRVVDVLRTYNLAGELVRVRYVATHDFAGQEVTDSDVVETTIAMGVVEPVLI